VILSQDSDRITYLELLRQYSTLHGLSLLGYCLMSNHIHLIAVPHSAQAMAQTLKYAHGRYASYWNARQSASGHVWQGRFYSCPLDDTHLWQALRYVELNPLRAGLVAAAEAWRWSSAAAHCGREAPDTMLAMQPWRKRWTALEWAEFLAAGESASELRALRQSTHTGRPLGTPDFVAGLERSTLRLLAPQKGGRPRKPANDFRQTEIMFVA
jgi:putative transposase